MAPGTAPNSPPKSKLWLAAIKPPMYSVAIMPILVGSLSAYGESGQLKGGTLGLFLVSAVLILAWENLSNDVFDSDTGIDVHKYHSVVNLTRNRTLVAMVSTLCLLLGIAGVGLMSWQQQDPTVLGLILLCCGLGYIYQGPPLRLGYRGLGEILCFFSFGPLGVGAAYYSQLQTWSWGSQAAGCFVGITTSLVLFCSHFHQVEDDLAAGKRSPIVRLGTQRAARLVPVVCGLAFTVLGLALVAGLLPVGVLLVAPSILSAWRLGRHVNRYHHRPAEVSGAKFYAIGLHFWSGLLLCVGLAIAALTPG